MPGAIRTFTPLVGAPNSQNANINSLVLNTQWATGQLTYSFPTDGSQFTGYNPGDEPFVGFVAAGAPYKAAVQFAYRTAAEFTNATFTEIAPSAAAPATMRFGITADPAPRAGTLADAAGWGYLPGDNGNAGDVWIVARQNMNTPFAVGAFQWSLVIHEIGHVLGLGHPFETGHAGGNVVMDPSRDSTEYTIMAYRASTTVPSVQTVGFPEAGGEPQTWMMYDVAALQAIYGANFNTRSGNTVYSWSPTTGQFFVDGAAYMDAPGVNRILMNVWDGGGIDTYDFSAYTTNARIDLRPGEFSAPSAEQVVTTNTELPNNTGKAPGSISNSLLFNGDLRSLIERAIGGSGNDIITGNVGDNTLTGGAGADTLAGGAGIDTADFSGSGAAVTVELWRADAVTGALFATDGTGSFDQISGIEALIGGIGADLLSGDNAANALLGGGGNDTLNGGFGDDNVDGGANDDYLFGAVGADTVIGGLGNDTIFGGDAGFSGDDLADSLAGGDGNDFLIGERGNDTLDGGLANDFLVGGYFGTLISGDDSGLGGDGLDTMLGEDGNDTLDGGNQDDFLIGGTENDLIRGEDGIDFLVGDGFGTEGGNDTIDGGIGNDLLLGGLGNDLYTGGTGTDQFWIRLTAGQSSGVKTITDFELGIDKIVVNAVNPAALTFAALQGLMTQNGANVSIDFTGLGHATTGLLIENRTIAQLQAGDFIVF